MVRALRTLVAAAAALFAWAVLIEPRRLVVRRREIEVDWPAHLDGLTIACVSDLHAGSPHMQDRRVRKVARRAAGLDADLVALLGDFVDPLHHLSRRVPPHVVAARLARLRAPLGVWAVLGNHDWMGEGEWMDRALHAARITVLQDEGRDAGRGLFVAGLSDLRTRDPDVGAAFEGAPDGAALLVLTHDPDMLLRLPDRSLLALAGHTHGGQVNVPGLRALVTPSRHGYRYGEFREGRRVLFVTAGVGTSGWPVRFLRPPEIVLLTVRASALSGRG